MLVWDSDRQLFMFVNPVAGITYESPDGSNWTISSVQVPLTATQCNSIQYVPRLGLVQANDGQIQVLQGNRWVHKFDAEAFAYNKLTDTWAYIQEGKISINGGAWVPLALVDVDAWGEGTSYIIPASPRNPVPGVTCAFWVMNTASYNWIYVSVKDIKGAVALKVTCLRTTLY